MKSTTKPSVFGPEDSPASICSGIGVVTGIPMEFHLAPTGPPSLAYSGGVIGQTFGHGRACSPFFSRKRLHRCLDLGRETTRTLRNHFLAAVGVALGSWLSGYFIIVTNAFMQHPIGYEITADGSLGLADITAYLTNHWAWIEFAHNQCAALVTGSFAITALGAFYTLRGTHLTQASLFLRTGSVVGLAASLLVCFPTGDQQAKMVAHHQPVTLAAMEGRFHGGDMADISVIGQPNVKAQRLDNPIEIPGGLSFLANGTFESNVHGLDEYPQENWPDNIELLYYAFHLMVTLGTIFVGLMALACLQMFRGKLETSPWLLWPLMLAFPFPFIANTLGWMTAELGRQPWLVYNLFRTTQGYSHVVSDGSVVFTIIGFVGLYFVLGLMFLYLVGREIYHGPEASHG